LHGEKECDDDEIDAVRTAGQVEKDETDAVGVTNKYCAKSIEDEDDGDEKITKTGMKTRREKENGGTSRRRRSSRWA